MTQGRDTNHGFTLIEMMIVLAIIGGVIAISMPYITNRNSQTKATLRQFVVLSRELHTKAKLQGATYRLVINLQDESNGSKRPVQTYWVEKGKANTVLKPNEEADALQRAKDRKNDKDAPPDPAAFEVDPSFFKKPKELPPGLIFQKVELARLQQPITSGKAFIHYLPQGLVDEAAIQLKGEKGALWTIAIHPLTGRAELISKVIGLKELQSQ